MQTKCNYIHTYNCYNKQNVDLDILADIFQAEVGEDFFDFVYGEEPDAAATPAPAVPAPGPNVVPEPNVSHFDMFSKFRKSLWLVKCRNWIFLAQKL